MWALRQRHTDETEDLRMSWTVACFCGNVFTTPPDRCEVCGRAVDACAAARGDGRSVDRPGADGRSVDRPGVDEDRVAGEPTRRGSGGPGGAGR